MKATCCSEMLWVVCFCISEYLALLKAICVWMLLRRCMVSQDRKQIGRKSAYQFWLLPSSLWHVLLVRSLKASAFPFQAHSSPISLIKVRLTLPVWSQVGHTAFMLGHAHYSDTLPVPPQLEAAHNARHCQPRDLGTLNSIWDSRNETTNCSPLTQPIILPS